MEISKNSIAFIIVIFAWTISLKGQDTMKINVIAVHPLTAFQSYTQTDSFKSVMKVDSLYKFVEKNQKGIEILKIRGMSGFNGKIIDPVSIAIDEAQAKAYIKTHWPIIVTEASVMLPDLKEIIYTFYISGTYGENEEKKVIFSDNIDIEQVKQILLDNLNAKQRNESFILKTPINELQIHVSTLE